MKKLKPWHLPWWVMILIVALWCIIVLVDANVSIWPLFSAGLPNVSSRVEVAGWTHQTLSSCLGRDENESVSLFSRQTALSASDRNEHFVELWDSTAAYRESSYHNYAGYGGPWLENAWIEDVANSPINGSLFVPLMVQWTDIAVQIPNAGRPKFCAEWVLPLFERLHSAFLYVTVIQHDEGITSWIKHCDDNEDFKRRWRQQWSLQILIINAGGEGHVAVPLCKETHPRCTNASDTLPKPQQIGFLGRPHFGRDKLISAIRDLGDELSLRLYHGDDWIAQECECCNFILTPRGYGRTAFSVCESIQMGLVPVYVWNDYPWIPYPSISSKFLVQARFEGSATDFGLELRDQLSALSSNRTKKAAMLSWIESHTASHFSFSGIVQQIRMLLIHGPGNQNDLECVTFREFTRIDF